MPPTARKITITGRVQGVGYRPFVYNKALELNLTGTVLNGSGKVFIQAEGTEPALDQLEYALINAAPPLARPTLAESTVTGVTGANDFQILPSSNTEEAEIHIPPDLYTCDDCVKELTTPEERRFGYPFINCTQCGPRYTIITAMPYDRPNTSMAGFPLCDDCRQEYESPRDRRFHAQPLACAKCGPALRFVGGRHAGVQKPVAADQTPVGASLARDQSPVGASLARDFKGQNEQDRESISKKDKDREQDSLLQTTKAIESGHIVAIKGVGGYHLVCDAANDQAVARLRKRKHRPGKPLAVMFPLSGTDGLDKVREHLTLDEITRSSLLDPARPIVLVKKGPNFSLSKGLAPGLRELGAFLPYSPLHHQLLKHYSRPIVATSGNISGEPVITAEAEAESRLAHVADAFLHHNRPIVRPADDPVVRPIAGSARAIRLGRGTAPLEFSLPCTLDRPMLAVGGHLKVTVALAWDQRMVVSPHIGELDSLRSEEVFKHTIKDLQDLYDVKSEVVVCDLHPGYASSQWAEQQDLPLIRVQHHAAHASALVGEHQDTADWLVFSWDGVGLGSDETLWGGEALAGGPGGWNRVASFRSFKLTGGDRAGREPWRSAAALLWEDDAVAKAAQRLHEALLSNETDFRSEINHESLKLAYLAWQKSINTHTTSAMGRLFDAASALILGRHQASFEGQGPMELEQMASDRYEAVNMPLLTDENGILRSDWAPILPVLCDATISQPDRSAIFHATMAQGLVDQAVEIRQFHNINQVGLTGGVFQNRLLTELAVARLKDQGFEVCLHKEVPSNDGGLSFGQIIEAMNS